MKYLKLFEEYNKIPNNLAGKKIFFNRIKKNFELEKMKIYEKSGMINIYYENFLLSYYENKNNVVISVYFSGKKSNVGKNLDFEIYRFFVEKIKEIQTFEFQKKFLTEHPDKLELLEQFGFAKGIKEEFPALFRAKEWGFFDLKEGKLFKNEEDLGFLFIKNDVIKNTNKKNIYLESKDFVVEGTFPIEYSKDEPYIVYKTKEGDLILTQCNQIFDYDEEVKKHEEEEKDDFKYCEDVDGLYLSEHTNYLEALEKIKKYFQSYKFQKKYIREFPNRVADLKEFGLNEKIKKEFPALVTGGEWGFFDLKENRLSDEEPDIFNDIKENFDIEKFFYWGSTSRLISTMHFPRLNKIGYYAINFYYGDRHSVGQRGKLPWDLQLSVSVPSKGNNLEIFIYIKGVKQHLSDNLKNKMCDFFINVLEKIKTYEFQKEVFLTKDTGLIKALKRLLQTDFREDIKKEFPALVTGGEWGFFDLKESANNKKIFKNQDDLGFAFSHATIDTYSDDVKKFEFEFPVDGYPSYIIYKTKDGDFILTQDDQIIDYDAEIEFLNDHHIFGASDKEYVDLHLKAIKKIQKNFIERWQSYKFQKEYLTKYPDRVKDLESFGIHPDIRKEFPALVRGSNWGFFDLKENQNTYKEKYGDLFLRPTDLGTNCLEDIKDVQKWNYIKLDPVINKYFIFYDDNYKYKIYITEKGKYILTSIKQKMPKGFKSNEFIDSVNILDGQIFYKIIKTLQSYEFQKKFIKENPNQIQILKDFGINFKIKKEFPALITGGEWGFFDLKND